MHANFANSRPPEDENLDDASEFPTCPLETQISIVIDDSPGIDNSCSVNILKTLVRERSGSDRQSLMATPSKTSAAAEKEAAVVVVHKEEELPAGNRQKDEAHPSPRSSKAASGEAEQASRDLLNHVDKDEEQHEHAPKRKGHRSSDHRKKKSHQSHESKKELHETDKKHRRNRDGPPQDRHLGSFDNQDHGKKQKKRHRADHQDEVPEVVPTRDSGRPDSIRTEASMTSLPTAEKMSAPLVDNDEQGSASTVTTLHIVQVGDHIATL